MDKEQIERLIEKPLTTLATELQKQGLMEGLTQEIISHILKNIRENK